MKISYIKLINNIGLTDSLNNNVFELNVPIHNRIVLVLGRNGIGKSRLLREFNPYFNKQNFVEAKEAYKEIHFYKENDFYIIKHKLTEGGKTTSFISKNGDELNPKGGVNLFKDIVREELHFTEDFFRIGNVGVNINNFIDLSSSERKQFIHKFIPDISEFLEINKQAKEHRKVMKRQIDIIVNNIDEIGNIDLDRNQELKESISKYEGEISDLQVKINTNLEKIKYDKEITNGGKSNLLIEKDRIETESDILADLISAGGKTLQDLENELKSMNSETMLSEINELKSLKLQKESKLEKNDSEIKASKLQISDKEKQIDVLNNRIIGIEETQVERNNLIISNPRLSDFEGVHTSIADMIHSNFQEAIKLFNKVRQECFKVGSKDEILKHIDKILDSIQSNDLTIRQLDKEAHTLKVELNFLNQRLENRKSLSDRPSNCKIDTCPFIKKALQYADPTERIGEIERRLAIINTDTVNAKKNYDTKLLPLKQIAESADSVISFLKVSSLKKFPEFNSIISKSQLIEAIFQDYESSNLIKTIEQIGELAKLNSKLMEDKSVLEDGISLQNEIITSLKSKIINLEDENTEIRNLIAKTSTDLIEKTAVYDNLIKNIEEINNQISNYTKLELNVQALKKLQGDIDLFEKCQTELAVLLEENDGYMNNLSTIKSELEICKESFLQTQIVIGKKNELDKALDRVKESYNEIQLIVDSTDPTKGIPLIITKKFLGAAESVTNDILNNVYNGQFNIQFRLNEKDFFIHVVKSNGSELDDVLDLSSGQCAIIKTALSFAMIQNFIGDYNIPILDELDSTLDENNRRSFLDILKRQIENTNIEQAFIISHNNEFFAEKDLTLLLFNGHSAPTSDASFVARNTIVNI